MATYGARYHIPMNILDKTRIDLWIYEKDYSSGYTTLTCKFDSLRITRDWSDMEDHVLGLRCEFDIVNTNEDFFTLMGIMTATEGKFKVKVLRTQDLTTPEYDPIITLFEGFINTDVIEQKYLHNQTINIVASSYLSKLEYYHPPLINELKNSCFMDVIYSMLTNLGSEAHVRVNCSLMPTEDYSGESLIPGLVYSTLFDKCGFFTELFWKNNIERENSIKVLEEILKTFNCYIYFYNGYWYIERYNDIWTDDGYINYIEYSRAPVNDSYFNVGGYVRQRTRGIYDVHNLKFIERTQTIYVTPGCKKVTIKVDDSLDDNLLPYILDDYLGSTTNTVQPEVPVHAWKRYENTAEDLVEWDDVGLKYKDIDVSIKRITSLPNGYMDTSDRFTKGLYTNFKLTVSEKTKLDFSCKVNLSEAIIYDLFTSDYDSSVLVRLYYGLRIIDGPDPSHINDVIVYNDYSDAWHMLLGFYDSASSDDALRPPFIETSLSSFKGDGVGTYTFSGTIPLFEVTDFPQGNYEFQLIVGPVIHYRFDYEYWQASDIVYFGDIVATVSGNERDDNYIEGTINTDYVNEKEITLILNDHTDLAYRSGVLRGGTTTTPLSERTETWRSKNDRHLSPLVDRILIDKFRFYNVSRQKIRGNVFDNFLWRPFTMFKDSKQSNKKFILVGIEHRVDINAYDLSLLEYDNETDIQLSEGGSRTVDYDGRRSTGTR